MPDSTCSAFFVVVGGLLAAWFSTMLLLLLFWVSLFNLGLCSFPFILLYHKSVESEIRSHHSAFNNSIRCYVVRVRACVAALGCVSASLRLCVIASLRHCVLVFCKRWCMLPLPMEVVQVCSLFNSPASETKHPSPSSKFSTSLIY